MSFLQSSVSDAEYRLAPRPGTTPERGPRATDWRAPALGVGARGVSIRMALGHLATSASVADAKASVEATGAVDALRPPIASILPRPLPLAGGTTTAANAHRCVPMPEAGSAAHLPAFTV